MRRLVLVAPILVLLAAAAPARASFAHTVIAGETLWSIATQDGLSPGSLAAYNGLSSDTQVIIGQTIQIPPIGVASSASSSSTPTTSVAEPAGDDAQDGASTASSSASSATSASPPPMGAYRVQLGDTLSAIAARAGVPTTEIAAMNGLTLAGPLLAGTVIKLPSGAPQAAGTPGLAASDATSTTSATPTSSTPTIIPTAAPNATPMRLDSSTIGQIASAEGVPPSLASAVAWQESGFNNGVVSSANARGVMQIIPGTWQWVQNNLTRRQLDPSSATDNVRAGSLYLGSLLRATGGDVPTAIAGYYQGLGSVRNSGMFPDTRQYVANVMALMPRFGG